MITPEARLRTIAAVRSLQSDGGFSDSPGGPADLGSTLAALKALAFLGLSPPNPDAVLGFVESHFDDSTGACPAPATGEPSVIATAGGLILLNLLDARDALALRLPRALTWMTEHAASREEHFMTMAVVDECRAGVPLLGSTGFFHALQQPDGTFGPSVLANGIASSALLRVGEPLDDRQAVARCLLGGQAPDGGFSDTGVPSDLWTTYCVMRALDLLGETPSRQPLANWVLALEVPTGGFGRAGAISAGVTYQCLSILDWICSPLSAAARAGDVPGLEQWLSAGGDPDVRDLQGWTPLMSAAVRGQAAAVELLLSDDIQGGRPANPDLRLPEADALPIFWAGQAGDIGTAAAILKRRPEHLFAVSSVNGHTVLLQAAFFGTQRHHDLAEWLLVNVGTILGLEPGDEAGLDEARRRLLEAANVRGYTALTMSKLWGNEAMAALFAAYDTSTEENRRGYLDTLLAAIARPPPEDPIERAAQELSDRCVQATVEGFARLNAAVGGSPQEVEAVEREVMAAIASVVENPGFEINRLAGPLSGTPVIVATTGVDAGPETNRFRQRLVTYLLQHGADPDLPELHPMAVDAVIRAAVLNHFEVLQILARFMGPLAFAWALNERPAINGQTALDDTVHRALTASDENAASHLDQIRWAIRHGARTDIEDFTGTSVEQRARGALDDAILRERAPSVLAALGIAAPVPTP